MNKYFFSWIFLFISLPISAEIIYFVPFPSGNPFYEHFIDDEQNNKWVGLQEELEKMGYEVRFTWYAENLKDFKAVVSLSNIDPKLIANLKKYPREKCWLYVFEPPIVMPHFYKPRYTKIFSKIFVMFDDVVDNKNYLKFYYPQPRQEMIDDVLSFEEKKLCVLIAGNKKSPHPKELYSERKKIISFFEQFHPDEFDLFGRGWEGFASYRGSVKSKWETLKYYRFCICYENMKDQVGYITEKIFDCFVGGCVPVYWGADNIADYVPSSCYIDRKCFGSNEELYDFLKAMDKETYEAYISSIKEYLASPQAKLYSINFFIEKFKEQLK